MEMAQSLRLFDSHVYLGGLVEGAVGVDVVVEDDDSHHHPHAEEQRVLAAETSRVFPGGKGAEEEEPESAAGLKRLLSASVKVKVKVKVSRHSRRLQHDLADAGHGAETVGRVLQRQSFILQRTGFFLLVNICKFFSNMEPLNKCFSRC